QPVNQQISRSALRPLAGQDKNTLESKPSGGRGGLTAMIRLQGAASDQGLRPLSASLRDQEFEFASLITTKSEAGLIVALNQQTRPPQMVRETRERFDRGGQMSKMQSGRFGHWMANNCAAARSVSQKRNGSDGWNR